MIHRLLTQLRERPEVAARLAGEDPRALRPMQLSSRWEGRNVWVVFSERQRHPVIVVKADHFDRYKARLRREHESLEALEARPELRGRVPEPLALMETGPALVLAQGGVPGRSLSVIVRQRLRATPRASVRDHRRILGWLAAFQDDGLDGEPVALSAKEVIDGAATTLDGEHPEFLARLSAMAEDWDGLKLSQVPGHGDLGPSNCLVDGDHVAIIDWEGGLARRSAVSDVVIFLNHYGRIHLPPAPRRQRWDDAFKRVFLSDHWIARVTAASFVAEVERLGLPTAASEYLFAATLAELATGQATAAHASAAERYWRPFFRLYAAAHTDLRIGAAARDPGRVSS